GEDGLGPLVVAGPERRVGRAGLIRPIEDEVEVGIVGDPSSGGRSAMLPRVAGPGSHAEVPALVRGVLRVCLTVEQHFGVGTGAVPSPGEPAGIRIVCREIAANAVIGAGHTDD